MGTKAKPGVFDCHKKANTDEPTFTILGRDPCAGTVIRAWCELRSRGIIKGLDNFNQIEEAKSIADAMDSYAEGMGKVIVKP